MLDIAVSYNQYKFLGFEFLTWLWLMTEHEPQQLLPSDTDNRSFTVGNRIVLENTRQEAVERITIKGDDADMEEGVLALRKGAYVTEINLLYQKNEHEWKFNLKGESLNISSLKVPETAGVENEDDVEGALLEKIYLYEEITAAVQALYKQFTEIRVSPDWQDKTVPLLKQWITK
jgi:hypothetical protein